MQKLSVSITTNDLIAEMVAENSASDIVEFISDLVDYAEGYHNFRDDVINRLEEDK